MKHVREFMRCLSSLKDSTYAKVRAGGWQTIIDGRAGTCPRATWSQYEYHGERVSIENDKFLIEIGGRRRRFDDTVDEVPSILMESLLKELRQHGAIIECLDKAPMCAVRFERKPEVREGYGVTWVKTREVDLAFPQAGMEHDFAFNPFAPQPQWLPIMPPVTQPADFELPPEFSTEQFL